MTLHYPPAGFVLTQPLFPNRVLNEFDNGRYDRGYGGGDWNAYQQGRNEKAAWDRNTAQNTPSSSGGDTNWGGGNSGGGGGGGGCGELILLVIGFMIAIPSVITGVVAGTVILVVSRFIPALSGMKVWDAYVASFYTAFVYFITAAILSGLLLWLYPDMTPFNGSYTIQSTLQYFYFVDGHSFVKPMVFLGFHTLCILAAAFMLKKKLSDYFEALAGYGRALLVTVLIIVPCLLLSVNFALPIVLQFIHEKTHLI